MEAVEEEDGEEDVEEEGDGEDAAFEGRGVEVEGEEVDVVAGEGWEEGREGGGGGGERCGEGGGGGGRWGSAGWFGLAPGFGWHVGPRSRASGGFMGLLGVGRTAEMLL